EAQHQVEVLDMISEVRVTLEQAMVSVESAETLSKWDRIFLQHSVQAVTTKTGLEIPTASLEAEAGEATQVSLEGLGGALKAVWDAIVKAVKAVWNAIAN